PDRAAAVLAEQAGAARQAITTLLDLSRGIYPRELADEGLVAAVRAAVTRSPVPVVVADDGLGRLPSAVETALYFFVMEAVQNAGKHSGAGAVHVHLAVAQGCWQARVADDGHGFEPAAPGPGSGLANLRDRLDAVAGTLSVSSGPTGTCVVGRVPVTAAVPRQAAGRKA
ncbi:MAG TPA: ATP-binding protein, partial [Mycobacteriales bacterium]|nr:ATP-binding protein [Mycobacteriales bacterium]